MRTFIPISELDNNPYGQSESKLFGEVAERLIFQDFSSSIDLTPEQSFMDNGHREENLKTFLVNNNKRVTRDAVDQFVTWCKDDKLMRFPDIMIHTDQCREFYEIKPNSRAGLSAGAKKVGILKAVYASYHLPYTAGRQYNPALYRCLAKYKHSIAINLRVQMADYGLLVYDLWVDYDTNLSEKQDLLVYRVMLIDLIRYVVFGKLKTAEEISPAPIMISDKEIEFIFSQRLGTLSKQA